MTKSTRVGTSLPPDTLAALDGLCAATGYSRSAVLHSLLKISLPVLCHDADRLGVVSYFNGPSRYRGASADALDELLLHLLKSTKGYDEWLF